MRTRLIACAGLVAVVAAAASIGDVSRADGARRAQPTVSYLLEVTFNLVYSNHWWTTSGQREDACEPWAEYDGTNDVWVENLGENGRPKKLKPLRGQISFGGAAVIGGVRLPSSWATLNVVGDATGAIRRRWEQDGGPESSPCGGRPVEPFKRLPDDCTRAPISTRAAVIRAEFRKNWSDLFNLTHTREQGKPVVSVSVPLGNGAWKLPFATCKTTLGAPEIFANLGLPVRPKDIQALRTLGLGKTYRLEWLNKKGTKTVVGNCDDTDEKSARNGCDFEVRGWIAIRHVSTFG
jgi:hypothetical protein